MTTAHLSGSGGPGLRIGLHALGIGSGSRPEILTAVARQAEYCGFATLWCGEHVVMVDEPRSRYPYSGDGKIGVPADADWLDPIAALAYLAAVTSKITLATGILLLPEHNPVLVAKQAASLDVLSAGRFSLGVGIGWSAEEFAALGVPFERRAHRTAEYVAVLRRLWSDDVASFHGEFVRFDSVRVYPKPVTARRIPVVLGGTTDAALRRVADHGDGWYGFSVPVAEVPERVRTLTRLCRQRGRDPGELSIAVSVADGEADVRELVAAGVTELVIVDAPPAAPEAAADWVSQLAGRWIRA